MTVYLEKIKFPWNGLFKGPCPSMLYTDPLLKSKNNKLFAEITSPMPPLPALPSSPNILFPKLRYVQIRKEVLAPLHGSSDKWSLRKKSSPGYELSVNDHPAQEGRRVLENDDFTHYVFENETM